MNDVAKNLNKLPAPVLRMLQVTFNFPIKPYELKDFRGAIVKKVGLEHDWFHNHNNLPQSDEASPFIYRYPLIQYRTKTQHGQTLPMLVCLGEGVDEIHKLFGQQDWEINLWGKPQRLRIQKIQVQEFHLRTSSKHYTYNLYKWFPLNQDNYRRYLNAKGMVAQLQILQEILRGNIRSFAKGIDWWMEHENVEVRLLQEFQRKWVTHKRTKLLSFDLQFSTNIFLPEFIGLGKAGGRGFGTVRRG